MEVGLRSLRGRSERGTYRAADLARPTWPMAVGTRTTGSELFDPWLAGRSESSQASSVRDVRSTHVVSRTSWYAPGVLRFHHVNLGVPVGGAEAEEAFLLEVLGYRRVAPPPELAGLARWFEGEDGKQIHLSEDPDHRPAARAHVAVEVGEELSAVEEKLEQAGVEHAAFDGESFRIVFCQDPAGNRWELRGAAPA